MEVAAASGDETLELELQRTVRVHLPVPGDEPAAGALQELPARQVRGLLLPSPLPRHAIASAFISVQSLCSLCMPVPRICVVLWFSFTFWMVQLQVRSAVQVRARVLSAAGEAQPVWVRLSAAAAAGESQPVWVRLWEQAAAAVFVRCAVPAAAAEAQSVWIWSTRWCGCEVQKRSWPGKGLSCLIDISNLF